MKEFAGKTALISGGAEGIGLAIAKALGEQEMNIVLADIDEGNLEKAAAELDRSGVPVLAVMLDVAEEAQWQNVAAQAAARFGKIHMLVNNAGVGGAAGSIESQSSDTWNWALSVNLMGVVFGAKTIVPLIKAHGEGGWVVNVGSMAGMGGVPYSGAYTATKSAVVALSESWAGELKGHDIAVSVLCPAFVQTRIYDSNRNRQARYQSQQTEATDPIDFFGKAKAAVQNGIDASIVGQRLVEALRAGELYIFTHPNYRPVVANRSKMINDAFERAAQSPLLQDIVNQKLEML
ncbi:SDR family NAD(P)-dependent oxidoreductase [Halieaceae bacterium IMCC14734]|uniref:SDR family NAD(P)-dependent oxidoreductase n=1 Tax=Candidatus Litorirhabdus singularis TaxID=2518993 RepID=A0ABT3TEE1_9GAMM|nr:SDR family NAD(P)-dependent oxidoreductase [Candidatus Litorirhabdus singularis]MCX2980677.1 SDR family NAD(P)-dependent oxidoreductase [Candidatus Litorirhabdus singularis]